MSESKGWATGERRAPGVRVGARSPWHVAIAAGAAALAILSFEAGARADDAPAPMREWAALGAGGSIPFKSDPAGLAISEELGRHWIGPTGEDGFGSGLLLGQVFRFPTGETLTSLDVQFRVLWDFAIPAGEGKITIGPAVAGGVSINLGGASTDVTAIVTPHVDFRWLLGPRRGVFLFARPALTLRFDSGDTATDLEVIGGAGFRFAVF
jgi:hypothetical protein